MNYAFFISPKGEVIYCGSNHISEIIKNPKAFGMTKEIIEYIHDMYNEKIGTEGKAREQILISLLNNGWIRIRRYKNFLSINVKKVDRKTKIILNKWAKEILKGKNGIKEDDPYIPVKIDTPNKKIMSSDINSIASSDSFVMESDDNINIIWLKDVFEIKDLKVYDCFKKYERMEKYLK